MQQIYVSLLGHQGAGKSSLITRLCTNIFDEFCCCCAADLDCWRKLLPLPTPYPSPRGPQSNVIIELLDTETGPDSAALRMEQLRFMHRDGAAVVFSVGDRAGFDGVEAWREEFLRARRETVGVSEVEYVRRPEWWPVVLVGTQSDRVGAQREVSAEQAREVAERWGVPYVECSSKTGERVQEVFETLAIEVLRWRGEYVRRKTATETGRARRTPVKKMRVRDEVWSLVVWVSEYVVGWVGRHAPRIRKSSLPKGKKD